MSFNTVLTELLTIAELGHNHQLRDVADRLYDAHNHELAKAKKAARHDKLLADLQLFQAVIASTINSNNRAATAEILAKIHHVCYRGLWTKPTAAARYWAKVRRHYEKGETSK